MSITTANPAFGLGSTAIAGLPATDQRGLPRVVAGQVDAGAYEIQAATPSVSPVGVTFSPNGQNVTLTASVSAPGTPSVNEGHVTFTVAGVTGVGAVSGGQATATLTLPAGLAPGAYGISAVYTDNSPDPGNFRSGSGAGTLTVGAAPTTTAASTTTKVLSVQRVGPFGLMEKVTVLVLDAAGNPVSGGSVTIHDGVLSQTVNLGGDSASATFSPDLLTWLIDLFLSHDVTATFSGTANDQGSSSATFVAPAGA
jgi:hypothetical protein